MNTKLFVAISLSAFLTSCSVISPLVVDYNGVRMDVAKAINNNITLSISDRKTLVAYAKDQQKILSSQYATDDLQQQLAIDRKTLKYCALQNVSEKKLTWVDSKIFVLSDQIEKLKNAQQLEKQIELNTENLDCSNVF